MQCRELKELMDSYLKDELLIETNHDVIQHLEACPACRRELAARRETCAQLRRAFATAPDLQMRPDFAFKMRNELKAQALGQPQHSFNLPASFMRPQWLALAACLVVAVLLGVLILNKQGSSGANQLARVGPDAHGGNRTPAAQPHDLSGAAVQLASFEVTERAVGDHQNCAIKYNLPEEPITLAAAGREYDAAYLNLAQTVQADGGALAGQIRYIEDHSCIYRGRRFAHVILEYKHRFVSLLVADANGANGNADGNIISRSQIDGYQVSYVGTKKHLIFVISDLPEADNMALARELAPAVAAHIARAEA